MKTSDKKFSIDTWSIRDNIDLIKKISTYLEQVGCFKHGACAEVVVQVSLIHEGYERQTIQKKGEKR